MSETKYSILGSTYNASKETPKLLDIFWLKKCSTFLNTGPEAGIKTFLCSQSSSIATGRQIHHKRVHIWTLCSMLIFLTSVLLRHVDFIPQIGTIYVSSPFFSVARRYRPFCGTPDGRMNSNEVDPLVPPLHSWSSIFLKPSS